MKIFDTRIIDLLNQECTGEPVHFVGVGTYNFQISFGNIERISTTEKAIFWLNGKGYSWTEGPTDIPVWSLVGQTPVGFELPNPRALKMQLISGDFVEFHTAESQYESVIIDFGTKGEVRVMEFY